MARKRKNRESSEGEFEDFVPAVFARSTTEAEEYRELLNDHDIPAIVETGEEDLLLRPGRVPVPPRPAVSRGVPILVPEALLDEASEILADRDFDEYRPGGEDEDAGDEDEEEELNLEPGPRPAGSDADEEEPAAKPKAADSPFEEDDEAFVIEEDDDEEEEEEEEEDDLEGELEENEEPQDEEEGEPEESEGP